MEEMGGSIGGLWDQPISGLIAVDIDVVFSGGGGGTGRIQEHRGEGVVCGQMAVPAGDLLIHAGVGAPEEDADAGFAAYVYHLNQSGELLCLLGRVDGIRWFFWLCGYCLIGSGKGLDWCCSSSSTYRLRPTRADVWVAGSHFQRYVRRCIYLGKWRYLFAHGLRAHDLVADPVVRTN